MTIPTNEQLARWIEAGLATPGVSERHGEYLSRDIDEGKQICRACALGLMAIGKVGLEAAADYFEDNPGFVEPLAEIIGITVERAEEIEWQHLAGGDMKSAAEIAAMLRRGEI